MQELQQFEQKVLKSKRYAYRNIAITAFLTVGISLSVLSYSDFDYTRAEEVIKDVAQDVIDIISVDNGEETGVTVTVIEEKPIIKVEKLSNLAPEMPVVAPVVIPVTVAVDIPIVDPIDDKKPKVKNQEPVSNNKTNTGLVGGGIKEDAEEIVKKSTDDTAEETSDENSVGDGHVRPENEETDVTPTDTITDITTQADAPEDPVEDTIDEEPKIDNKTNTGLIGGG